MLPYDLHTDWFSLLLIYFPSHSEMIIVLDGTKQTQNTTPNLLTSQDTDREAPGSIHCRVEDNCD